MTREEIMRRARDVAGCAWDDRDLVGTLSDQLRQVAEWPSYGSDGDLTDEDRAELRRLAEESQSC